MLLDILSHKHPRLESPLLDCIDGFSSEVTLVRRFCYLDVSRRSVRCNDKLEIHPAFDSSGGSSTRVVRCRVVDALQLGGRNWF